MKDFEAKLARVTALLNSIEETLEMCRQRHEKAQLEQMEQEQQAA